MYNVLISHHHPTNHHFLSQEVSQENIDLFLSDIVQEAVEELEESRCVALDEDGGIEPLTPGRICSYYYLKHLTTREFARHDAL